MLCDNEIRNRMKQCYPRTSQKFIQCLKFISTSAPLSQDMQQFMIVVNAPMIQSVFYDTVIYNMPDTSYESVIEAAAELYYYQRELNRRIGRTVYHRDSIDKTLLEHIYNEIVFRLSEVREYPCDEWYKEQTYRVFLRKYSGIVRTVTSVQALKDSLLAHYQNQEQISYKDLKEYLNQIAPNVDYAAPEVTFEQYMKFCMERNRTNPQNSDICSEDRYKKLLNITRNASFYKRLPNKDELYSLCIAVAVSYSDFIILRQCVERELKDSATYADNDFNSRDSKIQSVIRDIDYWYKQVRGKYLNLPIEQAPKRVILEVNRMLRENNYVGIYRGKNEAEERG